MRVDKTYVIDRVSCDLIQKRNRVEIYIARDLQKVFIVDSKDVVCAVNLEGSIMECGGGDLSIQNYAGRD